MKTDDIAAPSPAYFGRPWDVPALEGAVQVDTPVGQKCLYCPELIADGDRGWLRPVVDMDPDTGSPFGRIGAVHAECELRGIMGHKVGVCGCTGWDPDRAAAREVWRRAGLDPTPPAAEPEPEAGNSHARDLPVHTIVATTARVWIKRSNGDRHPKGTPFHETWWIEASTYSVQVGDQEIQQLLASGKARVLRRGKADTEPGHPHIVIDCPPNEMGGLNIDVTGSGVASQDDLAVLLLLAAESLTGVSADTYVHLVDYCRSVAARENPHAAGLVRLGDAAARLRGQRP